jgi:hypothetical protein
VDSNWIWKGAWSGTQSGVKPIEALILGLRSFSFWLHTTVFQAEVRIIKPCEMGNNEKGYAVRNICILSDS